MPDDDDSLPPKERKRSAAGGEVTFVHEATIWATFSVPAGRGLRGRFAHAGPLSRQWCVKIGPDGSLPGRSAPQQGRGKRRVAAATLLSPAPAPLNK